MSPPQPTPARAVPGREASDQQAAKQDDPCHHQSGRERGPSDRQFVVAKHGDSPHERGACGKKRACRPQQWPFRLPQGKLSDRRQVLALAAGDARGYGIRGQFLLQSQAAGQPMQQRMIDVQHQGQLPAESPQAIVPPGMSDLVGQDGAAFVFAPRAPIGRNQERGAAPPDHGRRHQVVALADLDVPSATQFRAKHVDQLGQFAVADRLTAPSLPADAQQSQHKPPQPEDHHGKKHRAHHGRPSPAGSEVRRRWSHQFLGNQAPQRLPDCRPRRLPRFLISDGHLRRRARHGICVTAGRNRVFLPRRCSRRRGRPERSCDQRPARPGAERRQRENHDHRQSGEHDGGRRGRAQPTCDKIQCAYQQAEQRNLHHTPD